MALAWPFRWRMTTPSKIWICSLSPSLIFVWTRTVSPERKWGTSALRYFASMSLMALRSIALSPSQLVVSGSQEPEVLIAQRQPREEVGAPLARGLERLAPPPPLDPPVVPRQEDLRNLHPPVGRGPGVVRVLQQPSFTRKALRSGGALVSEHPRDEPRGG